MPSAGSGMSFSVSGSCGAWGSACEEAAWLDAVWDDGCAWEESAPLPQPASSARLSTSAAAL